MSKVEDMDQRGEYSPVEQGSEGRVIWESEFGVLGHLSDLLVVTDPN